MTDRIQIHDVVKHVDAGHYPHYGIVRRISITANRKEIPYTCVSVAYTYPGGGGMTLDTAAYFFTVVDNINELVTLEDLDKD